MVDALKNASGVQAFRWYGVYEYYTIRGFNQADVMLVDGMRLEGNRINTQTNNMESVEVLKGPSSVLYGGGALGGIINVVRKKPQGTRAYDLMYRGGRFNSHQIAGGAHRARGQPKPPAVPPGRELRPQRRLAQSGSRPRECLAHPYLAHQRTLAPDGSPGL